MNKELMQKALDALTCSDEVDDPGHRCGHCDDYVDRNRVVREALAAALALPDAQPIGFVDHWGSPYWYNADNNPPPDDTQLYAAPQPAPAPAPSAVDFDSQEFYELMQTYRHTPGNEIFATGQAFEAVKNYCKRCQQ